MISAIIDADGQDHALAVTLASLVPAAAEGFVREVLVLDATHSPGVRMVVDVAGCTLVEGGRDRAIALARADWILLVSPGFRLESGWFREAAAFIEMVRRAGGRHRAAAFRHVVEHGAWSFGLRARLRALVDLLVTRRQDRRVVLAPKAALITGRRLPTLPLRARAFVGGPGD